jgi:predicted dehydrogenase
VEQAVHSIDKMLWTMKDEPPAKVVCTGGRQMRPGEPGGEYGNIFDHFSAEYTWENGVKGYHFTRQMDKCYNENSDTVFGTKGVYQGESGGKRHVIVKSDNPWRYKAPAGFADNGYETEHEEMYKSIRAGKAINTGERFCKTTLMAIMARMSAYTGKEITWEMAMNSKEDTFPKDIHWDMKLPVAPLPKPGITPFI